MSASLTIDADEQEISKAVAFAEEYIASLHLSHDLFCSFAAAIDEVLANTIAYAFKDKNKHQIKISLKAENKTVTVVVEDDGDEFNPLLFPVPCIDEPLCERAIGGLGIHILKNIMDSVAYERKDNKNILTLTKVDDK
ncbi:MAG: ATP-binding protein [Alphaproteobacteria bacterium]|nr:ATP-binding protein [Alphaproteobacteria bacterium]